MTSARERQFTRYRSLLCAIVAVVLLFGCTTSTVTTEDEYLLYVLTSPNQTVTCYAVPSGSELSQTRMPGWAFALTALPDGMALITVCGRPTDTDRPKLLVKLHGQTGRIVSTHELELPNPRGVVVDPASRRVYVTHAYELPGQGYPITILNLDDLDDQTTVWAPGATGDPHVLPDGRLFLRVVGGGQTHYGFTVDVMELHPENDELRRTFNRPIEPIPIGLFPVFQHPLTILYLVGNAATGAQLSAVDIDSFSSPRELWSLSLGNIHGQQIIGVDGRWLVINDFNPLSGSGSDLVLVDIDTQRIIARATDLPTPAFITASETSVYAACMSTNEIIRLSLPDLNIVSRISTATWPSWLAVTRSQQ